MNCEIIRNRLTTPDGAIKLLLAIAWDAARAENRTTPGKIVFKLAPSRSVWNLRYKNWSNQVNLCIDEKCTRATLNGVGANGFEEVFAGLAAWAIAGILNTRQPKLAASEAVYMVREQAETLKAKLEAVKRHVADRAGRAFAREILLNMKHDSLEYKLGRIADLEKVWLRKFKLAQTKLKTLRRRRSALLAADKRRNAVAA